MCQRKYIFGLGGRARWDSFKLLSESLKERQPAVPVYPLIFTNKSEISPEAIEKARGNVRIIRSSEFTTLMLKYIELMQKGWRIDDPSERLSFMMNIPSLEKFEIIFKTANEPLVSLEDVNSVI